MPFFNEIFHRFNLHYNLHRTNLIEKLHFKFNCQHVHFVIIVAVLLWSLLFAELKYLVVSLRISNDIWTFIYIFHLIHKPPREKTKSTNKMLFYSNSLSGSKMTEPRNTLPNMSKLLKWGTRYHLPTTTASKMVETERKMDRNLKAGQRICINRNWLNRKW